MESAQQARQAPPVGRALRILLGLALMVYVAPVYFQVPARVSVGSLLLIVGLIGIYTLLHITLSQQILPLGSGLGAIVANGLLVVLYFIGATGLPIVGGGKGALAAVTFRYLIGGCGRARRSRVRSDGDPRSLVWKAHRTGVSYLLSPRPA